MAITESDERLLRSARTGNTIEAIMALEAGADIHCNNDDALHAASWRGSTTMVRLLLDHGADATSRNSEAAIQAASFEHREIVEMLVANGASDDALCVLELFEQGYNLSGKAPLGLLSAARFGLLREARVLLEKSHKHFDKEVIERAIVLAQYGDHQDVVALLSQYPEEDKLSDDWALVQTHVAINHRLGLRITKEDKETIVLLALKDRLDDETASQRIGISKRTFRSWKSKYAGE